MNLLIKIENMIYDQVRYVCIWYLMLIITRSLLLNETLFLIEWLIFYFFLLFKSP